MDETPIKIGAYIQVRRKMIGLSQSGLAKEAGVGKTVVFDIEHEKTTVQMAKVLKILKALDVTIQLKSPFGDSVEIER